MELSLRIIDLNLEKVYNGTIVSNNDLANATDYLDYIIMNILVLEKTTQSLIANVIMPNINSKLDPTDAGWIRDFYFQKVYIDATQTLNLESALLLKEVCKKLLYNKYVYKNILSPHVPEDLEVDPVDPVTPPANTVDTERYQYDDVMSILPNDNPAIDPEFIGVHREIIKTDRYIVDYPVLPDLPATAEDDLPMYYKDTYYEALRLFSKTIASNTAQLTHNLLGLSTYVGEI